MDLNILTKIAKQSKAQSVALDSLSSTVDSIKDTMTRDAKLEAKAEKKKEADRKRETQKRRREAGDLLGAKQKELALEKDQKEQTNKDDKKKSKSFLSKIVETLGGLGPLLTSALGGLGIGAAIGGALAAAAPILLGALGVAMAAGLGWLAWQNREWLSAQVGKMFGGQGDTVQEQAQNFADDNRSDASEAFTGVRISETRMRVDKDYKALQDDAEQKLTAAREAGYSGSGVSKEDRARLDKEAKEADDKRKAFKDAQDRIVMRDNMVGQLERVRNNLALPDDKIPWYQLSLYFGDVKAWRADGEKREKDLLQNITQSNAMILKNADILGLSDEEAKALAEQWNDTDYTFSVDAGQPKDRDERYEEDDTNVEPVRRQEGGYVVPGHGNGDQVPMMLPSGSFVMNRNAVDYLQGGGETQNISTILEPGERVFLPGQWSANHMALNDAVPRFGGPRAFQNGGKVSEGAAGSSRGGSTPTPTTDTQVAQVTPDKKAEGKTGAAAILAAAESSTGLSKGVGEQCANTTRAVLRRAGHPAADKRTGTGDLDPEGLKYNGSGFAASFAGSDMGAVKQTLGEVQPGDIMLWKDTYGNYAPGAITHVGIAGEGNTQYHHGRADGWRKTGRAGLASKFAYGIDLNGEAGGFTPDKNNNSSDDSSDKGSMNISDIFSGGFDSLTKLGGNIGIFLNSFKESFFSNLGSGENGIDLSGLFGGLFSDGKKESKEESKDEAYSGDGESADGSNGAATITNPNAKALLNALAEAEGTTKYPNQGYNTMFTGKQFKTPGHPRQMQNSSGYSSDAAGRYQFLSTTWDEYNAGNDDMSPANQDNVALKLVSQKRKVNIDDGLSINEIYQLGREWASVEGGKDGVKGGSYGGQAKYSAENFMKMYERYGGAIQKKQSGGIVNLKSAPSQSQSRMKKAHENYSQKLAAASNSNPIVVIDAPPTNNTRVTTGAAPNQRVPKLPSGPSSATQQDYIFRLPLGGKL